MTTMHAQYETQCGACGGKIHPGDVITLGTASFWEHAVCPPAKFDITREICGVCFTEKSVTGDCLCEAMP